MIRSSDDLPEPERPSSETISPSVDGDVDAVEHQRPLAVGAVGHAHFLDLQQAVGVGGLGHGEAPS